MDKIKKYFRSQIMPEQVQRLCFLAVITIFAVLMRFMLFPLVTNDMGQFITEWYEYFKANGGFAAVGDDIGDYTPAYYYIIAAFTYIPLPVHIGIKSVSCIFDFILACYVMKIVELKDSRPHKTMLAFALTICLPTVVMNSAAWGQCDVIYTAFLIICLYNIMIGRNTRAMIFFGLAFSFKIQTIFMAPLILILLIKKKIRFRTILIVPAVYIVSIIPAVIASGGDFGRLLTVYIRQSQGYDALCLGFPNIWTFAGSGGSAAELFSKAGVFFAGAVVLIFVYYYINKKDAELSNDSIVSLALLSVFIVPFVLPHMHDRYYYPLDIMFVIFSFYNPKYFWLIFTSQFCSIEAYSSYIFEQKPLDLRIAAIVQALNAFVVYKTLEMQIKIKNKESLNK